MKSRAVHRAFEVLGTSLHINADDVAFIDALEVRFGRFRVERAIGPDTVHVSFQRVTGSPYDGRTPPGRTVYESDTGLVTYVDQSDQMVVRTRISTTVADFATATVTTVYESATDATVALTTQPVLSIVLMELFKRRGLYPLHAAAIADDGRAVLLAGDSGVGKSTLSVAVGRAGFEYLSDDLVVLHGDDDLVVRGFPDTIDLSDESANRFAPTTRLAGRPTWGDRPKHRVTAPMLDLKVGGAARPVALVFPQLTYDDRHELSPLAPDQALLSLVSNVLLTDAVASGAHLDAIGRLVRSTPCHRLRVGLELGPAVELIRQLLRPTEPASSPSPDSDA